jgi:hypothetical protein
LVSRRWITLKKNIYKEMTKFKADFRLVERHNGVQIIQIYKAKTWTMDNID